MVLEVRILCNSTQLSSLTLKKMSRGRCQERLKFTSCCRLHRSWLHFQFAGQIITSTAFSATYDLAILAHTLCLFISRDYSEIPLIISVVTQLIYSVSFCKFKLSPTFQCGGIVRENYTADLGEGHIGFRFYISGFLLLLLVVPLNVV